MRKRSPARAQSFARARVYLAATEETDENEAKENEALRAERDRADALLGTFPGVAL